jgi:hypothetical protein
VNTAELGKNCICQFEPGWNLQYLKLSKQKLVTQYFNCPFQLNLALHSQNLPDLPKLSQNLCYVIAQTVRLIQSPHVHYLNVLYRTFLYLGLLTV